MLEEELVELSRLQLARASELLTEASALIALGAYNSAVNRAYYAAFHAMKAIEALDNYDSKRHTGVIQYFRRNYIKTGLFDTALSGILDRLQNARGDSDYNITVRFSPDDAAGYQQEAQEVVDAIARYLRTRYEENTTD